MKIMLLVFALLWAGINPASAQISVYNLTCEQEVAPIGIENQHPCFSWKAHSVERGYMQSAYELQVAESPEMNGAMMWNSGKMRSSQSVLVPYDGSPLKTGRTYYWRVRCWNGEGVALEWSGVESFTMGLFGEQDWDNAQWISLQKDSPGTDYIQPQFRKAFSTGKPIRKAVASVAGLGHFDFYLNGKKVGDHFLDAGWVMYPKQALYVSFDVTDQLTNGENVAGVMLGNGFYHIPNKRYIKLLTSFGAPKMRMHLQIEYTDGSTQTVVSDPSWKAVESPITFSSIYGGEDYDATLVKEGWMRAGYDDTAWSSALSTEYAGEMLSQRIDPLKVHAELPVVTRYKNGKGSWVYDLGQNASGVVRIVVKGQNKQALSLYPAELLNADSSVNQSATGDPFYFSYTLSGGTEPETWQPQFTYYGFRYVQVEGAVPAGESNPDNLPEIVSLTGLHTCNSAPEAGSFSCSNPMFNRIHNLIDWAIRSNMASVLTDCPHREKLGWLEQAHLMQYSLQYRYNLSRAYPKIMNDMEASQLENGTVPTIAPEYVRFANGFEDTPEWGSSFIISPWYIYQWYGDKRLLTTHYANMQRYLDYLGTRADNHIIAYGLGDWFDIGPESPGYAQLTSNGVTATAIYYYNTTIMRQVASLLGKEADAKRYESLAAEIKKAFNKTFFDPQTRKYDRNSQTASAVALYMDLVEPENKAQVLDNLIQDIRSRNNGLTAGDIGYRYVLRALEANGKSDIIYDMNSKYDVPGYGWQLAHGATALTESWQAYGFVSNNHFMLGHLMEWLYSGLGGIRQTDESVGFKTVVIDPRPVGDIRSASTSYESPYGQIRCEWKDTDREYFLDVEIPANSEALIYLPVAPLERISEHGKSITNVKGIEIKAREGNKICLKVGSGSYSFAVRHN